MKLHPDDKLIRDNIPELAAARGERMECRIAALDEFPLLVADKLLEEAREFHRDMVIEELGDVSEVIRLASLVFAFPLDRVRAIHRGQYANIPTLSVALVGAAWAFKDTPTIVRFADVVDIFDEICRPGTLFDPARVERQRLRKLATNGGFDRKYVWRKPPHASSPASA